MITVTLQSNLWDICEQCNQEGEVFYDDDGNLLCHDCLFENETLKGEYMYVAEPIGGPQEEWPGAKNV